MFIIKCFNCNWQLKTLGDKKSIADEDLQEVKSGCSTCGKPRKFKCKKCGTPSKMFRVND